MNIRQIENRCMYMVCHPDEQYIVKELLTLVEEAKALSYDLEFHIGQNLLGDAYLQGYTLEKEI